MSLEIMQFNDLPDEMVTLIIGHTHPGLDHRSRILTQDYCRELLNAHEHDSLITEKLIPQLTLIPTDRLKFNTFLKKLERYLSPVQLEDIADLPVSERITHMALIAQENQNYALAVVFSEITETQISEAIPLVANRFRNHLRDQRIDLGAITKLNLAFLQMISLPDEISQFSSLTRLILKGNQLTFVPDNLGQLSNLDFLDLSSNCMTVVPDNLGQLANLDVLDLSNNCLTVVPDSLGQLQKLKSLFLNDNQLTSVPDSLGNLTELLLLNLSNNQLTSIPDNLGLLPKLQFIYLENNQLPSFPDNLQPSVRLVFNPKMVRKTQRLQICPTCNRSMGHTASSKS